MLIDCTLDTLMVTPFGRGIPIRSVMKPKASVKFSFEGATIMSSHATTTLSLHAVVKVSICRLMLFRTCISWLIESLESVQIHISSRGKDALEFRPALHLLQVLKNLLVLEIISEQEVLFGCGGDNKKKGRKLLS